MKENDLIRERNYLGAYYVIKNNDSVSKEDRIVRFGHLANVLLDEMVKERSENKINFLNSILLLISKEVPGFYEVYIKSGTKRESDVDDIVSSTKNVYDVIQGKKTISEGIIDSIETNSNVLKRNIESIAGKVQSNAPVDTDVLSKTTSMLTDGIDNFTRLLKDINEKTAKSKNDTSSSSQDNTRNDDK